jgi:hypothetical protein
VIRRRKWLYWIGGAVVVVILLLIAVTWYAARRFEPYLREQTIAYLEKRFDSKVEMGDLDISLPFESPIETLRRAGEGWVATVNGGRLILRYQGRTDIPPFFAVQGYNFQLDVGSLIKKKPVVQRLELKGLEVNIPPKGERPPMKSKGGAAPEITIALLTANGSKLAILPKDPEKEPLRFDIHELRMRDAGAGRAMPYEAQLTNAKPPGIILAKGGFGPWNSQSISDTPLDGDYTYDNADLGVFKGIKGSLSATGHFQGVLGNITTDGESSTPDFRLSTSGNPVPLHTKFHAVVDGTNGNTILQPVIATLGRTRFRLNGGVVRYAGDRGKTISLNAVFEKGYVEDALRLAMKGKPILEGPLDLKVTIDLPPGKGEVADRLRLAGRFALREAQFTSATVQQKIDEMSRKAQGQPKNPEINQVAANLQGTFRVANGVVNFPELRFLVPGAAVDLAGNYKFRNEQLDFHGTLRLDARLSQTQSGWKRILLKPIDPFFAKDGAGMLVKIKVTGTRSDPEFGRDK